MAQRLFNSIIPKVALAIALVSFIASPSRSQKVNVLFVGNSLTYSNNLPEIVKQVAICDSVELNYKMLALPNYAVEDHLRDGHVVSEIKSGKYDFVIVQQGPSSQQEGRMMLLNDGLKLAKLCAENKTRLAFFTVWPAKERFGDFPRVLETYQLAADSTKSILCPAGNAWLKVWDANPEIMLYSVDNFHPSYRGSLLAAIVIYGSIRKKTNLSFVSYNLLSTGSVSRAEFKILVEAAQQTLSDIKRMKREKRK